MMIREKCKLEQFNNSIDDIDKNNELASHKMIDKISEDSLSKTFRVVKKDTLEGFRIRVFYFENFKKLENIFKTEVLSMTAISHPNIMKFYKYEYGEVKTALMQKDAETESLSYFLSKNNSAKSENIVIKIILGLCQAIECLHELEIVHKYINPMNIFVQNGVVKLSNFFEGFLFDKSLSSIEQIQYFSPEQIKKENLDERSDIFSLGLIFYELATGKKPFNTSKHLKSSEIERNIVEENTTIPSLYNLDLSSELEKMILKCLEKDKDDRYQTITILKNSLESYIFKNKL